MKTLSNGDGYTNVRGDLTRVHQRNAARPGKACITEGAFLRLISA
jgi:hypothetical protein